MTLFDPSADPIQAFERGSEYAFLSNFFPSSFYWRGLIWRTAEHAYQTAKATNPTDAALVRNQSSPGKAKRAGRLIACRSDWDDIKLELMAEIVYAKFNQSPMLRHMLASTGQRYLEEGNLHRDTFWGVYPPRSGCGTNHLGWILMEVRERLSQAPALMCYAGIGSRETPFRVQGEMIEFGAAAAEAGLVLRSGGAVGADTAFEQGCRGVLGACEIFIPWEGYNGRTHGITTVHEKAPIIASTIHPAWTKLSSPAKTLVSRNMQQILGAHLIDPSYFVVCWTPDGAETTNQYGIKTGGTGTAISLASKLEIPVYNLYNHGRLQAAYDHIERLRS